MEVVYTLRSELVADPEQMRQAQALTRDASRPHLGLAGRYGLFGSDQWWVSIAKGRVPTVRRGGTIERVYTAGMEREFMPNAIDFRTSTGEIVSEGLYANSDGDRQAYQPGHEVEFLVALDPLKAGGHSEIVLEVRVGLQPRWR